MLLRRSLWAWDRLLVQVLWGLLRLPVLGGLMLRRSLRLVLLVLSNLIISCSLHLRLLM